MRVTRSNIVLALAALSVAAGVLAQTKPAVPTKGEGASGPLPPGPHFIITLPIVLRSMPPEVNQFEVDCTVFGPGGYGMGGGEALGGGAVTGPITAMDVRGAGVFSVEATVDVFLRNPTRAAFADVSTYRCELFLNGTASGHTQRYFGGTGSVQMPVSPGAPHRREVGGPIPP